LPPLGCSFRRGFLPAAEGGGTGTLERPAEIYDYYNHIDREERKPMELGLHLPQIGPMAGAAAIQRVAAHAEQGGLASLWVSDHVTFPCESKSTYPYSADGTFPVPLDAAFLDPLVTLSFAAAITQTVRLGTSVLVVPLRRTAVLAKQITSLQVLCGERLIFGAGVGWLEEEFVAVGADFANRGTHFEQAIEQLRAFLTGTATCDALGGTALLMEPRPQVPPPVWIGGSGRRALERAGRLADAWHAPGGGGDPAALLGAMQIVGDSAERAGRARGDVSLTTRMAVRPGAATVRARLDALRNIGCSHVVLDPVAPDTDTVLRIVDELADLDL
jgi:probable F420-dependent oxidoreductase